MDKLYVCKEYFIVPHSTLLPLSSLTKLKRVLQCVVENCNANSFRRTALDIATSKLNKMNVCGLFIPTSYNTVMQHANHKSIYQSIWFYQMAENHCLLGKQVLSYATLRYGSTFLTPFNDVYDSKQALVWVIAVKSMNRNIVCVIRNICAYFPAVHNIRQVLSTGKCGSSVNTQIRKISYSLIIYRCNNSQASFEPIQKL